MITTLKKLGKLSLTYTLGDMVTKGAALLLLPLYTRFLTPDDYGILAIVLMVSGVMGMLISFGMMSAILRFHFLFDNEQQRQEFYGTLFLFLLLMPGLIVWSLDQFGESLFTSLFRQTPFQPYIRLGIWTAFFNTAFSILPPTLFRAREQAKRYVAFSLFKFVATTVFTIWLVVFQNQGAVGAAWAQFLASVLTAVPATAILLRQVRLNLHWRKLVPALAFGIPLIPHLLSYWALSISDRAILERHVSLDQLGLYSLGYQFGIAYNMIIISINNSLLPMFGRSANSNDELQRLSRIATYYILVIGTIGLAIALLAPKVIILITPPEYHSAGLIVPWIILGYSFLGFYYLPMNTLSMTVGKTRTVPLITITSALFNIGLNLLMVPRFGIIAAAINTALGYGALAVLMFVSAQKTRSLNYEYGRLSKIGLSIFFLFMVSNIIPDLVMPIALVMDMLLVCLLPFMLFLMGFWTEQEKRRLHEISQRIAPSLGALK